MNRLTQHLLFAVAVSSTLFLNVARVQAQELNCRVQVIAPQISNVES